MLDITPIPVAAAGVANAAAAVAQFVGVEIPTAPFTTVHLGAGIDPVSMNIGLGYTEKALLGQWYFLLGTHYLLAGGEMLAIQSPLYTIWDNWAFQNFFI